LRQKFKKKSIKKSGGTKNKNDLFNKGAGKSVKNFF
jgi:hypothetical protein